MMIVPMVRPASTDSARTHVTVAPELSALLMVTGQCACVLLDMLATLRSPVILLDVSQTMSAETERPVSRETVSTHVCSMTHVEGLLSATQLNTAPTVAVCLDMKETRSLVVKLSDVALILSVPLTGHVVTRTVLILVSMRIHVPRMLNVLSVITSLSVAVPLVTQATLVWPVSPSHHQSVSRTRTVHHNTLVSTTGVSSSVPSSARVETPPPAPSLTLCQCAP